MTTLTELLPSLRSSLPPHLDPGVWPLTARWGAHGDLLVGGVRMTTLAATYGTPVHVLDEADVRARCAEYLSAFGKGSVAYSAKAGLTVGAGRWIAEAGLGCYVACADELRIALLAGFRPAGIVLYGHTKSVADLDAAFACGAAIVAGSCAEVETIAARAPIGQRVYLRVVGSVAGRGRCRYGLRLGSSTALAAIKAVLAAPNLRLAGLDLSIGHQQSRFHLFESSLRETMAFCAVIRSRYGVSVPVLNLGGGHAVAYANGDDGFAVAAFAARIHAMMRLSAERYGIAEPRLTVSPGRSIIARAGLTLYRVTSASLDDEGIPDCAGNPDCAGRHTIEVVGRVAQSDGVAAGDLVAVAGTGAYHHRRDTSAGRPAVVAIGDGRVRTLVRRENLDDLLRRTIWRDLR